jgi:putative ABC transport system permease protein
MTGLQVGDELIIRSTQGREYEFFALQVAGITESRKYSLQASIFVPIVTWDKIRPKGAASPGQEDPACNVAAVQLEDPAQIDTMKARIEAQVEKVEAVDRQTAYESTPGYTEQQSTLNAQNGFALLIGVLVIGGFFQIQTLQKVPQIGMLKAIGTPNRTVALAAMVQIVIVTVVGAALGSLAAFGLSFAFPPNVPIIFEPRSGAMAVVSILLIGPRGGLVAVRNALRVEPLVALGLG